MEAYIGDKEAAADHECGHALVGTFENGWDRLRRARIIEGNNGWGGDTDFDRLSPDARALSRVAVAGTLAEAKGAIQRQGHVGNLEAHEVHAHNIRMALNELAADQALPGTSVEISAADHNTKAALSLRFRRP